MKKNEIQFFSQRHALLTSFDIFVVTYRVTNFLPKLIHMLLFSAGKNWISIFLNPLFSGIAGSTPGEVYLHTWAGVERGRKGGDT